MSEEKHNEEKEKKGTHCGKKWRSDKLDAVGWAAIFIWGALVLLAQTTNYAANFSWWKSWSVFFAGAGVIVLLGVVVRLLLPEYRHRVVVSLIFGFILLGIGLGSWTWIWVLVLFAIGITILISAFRHRC